MSLEDQIRTIVAEEMAKRQVETLMPVSEFCKQKNISRTSVWKAEKTGDLIIKRVGRKVFVVTSQFGR